MNPTAEPLPTFQVPALIKPRDPKIANILAKSCPGLGHIYAGDIRRGLAILAAVDLPLAVGAVFLVAPWGMAWVAAVLWIVAAVISVLSIVDAKKVVLRTRADYRMKDYNHWLAYAVIGVVPTLAAAIAVAISIMTTLSQAIVAASPLPEIGIQAGDRFVEWKTAYRKNPPAEGDYVTYRRELGSRMIYMGRIIALPGDTILTTAGETVVPQGFLGLQRTDAGQPQHLVSEVALTGKLTHRFWPPQRMGPLKRKAP